MKRLLSLMVLITVTAPAIAAEWDATVHWAGKVALGTPVSGVVQRVETEAGDVVKKGQALLTLEETPFVANVQQAEAAALRARLTRDEAKRDLAQAEELYARTVLSTVELENAKLKFGRTDADVKQAEAELARARYELRQSTLRAPFDALVLERAAEPGQSVAANLEPPVLFVLVRRGEYLATARVPIDVAANIKPGQAATVVVNGQRFAGKLKAAGLEAVKDVRETVYEVTVIFKAGDTLLRAGQPAKIVLP